MRDSDVRKAVLERLVSEHASDDSLIVQEMGVWSGSVRIDVAVINGELTGYELKSERDTLARLPLQADIYSRVFDRLTLVVAERHEKKAAALIPPWWGVTIASTHASNVLLSVARTPHRNPSQDAYLIAQLLWKEEALAILGTFDLAKGWRAKRIRIIHERLAAELPLVRLTYEVRQKLKSRTYGWLRQDVPC